MERLDNQPQTTSRNSVHHPSVRLPYPTGVTRHVVRLPIWMYRLGLGSMMSAMRLMVLSTWGRKSGLPRHAAIEYRTHGSKIYVVSAWGRRPNWCVNLTEQPVVRVRLGRRAFSAKASVVEDTSEALRVLYLFRKRAPFIYDPIIAYLSNRQSVNSRTLPDVSHMFTIVRLDPSADVVGPPTVEPDLRWVLPVTGGLLLILWRLMLRRSRG